MAGNVNFARAREGLMKSELLGADLEQCFPLMELEPTLLWEHAAFATRQLMAKAAS